MKIHDKIMKRRKQTKVENYSTHISKPNIDEII